MASQEKPPPPLTAQRVARKRRLRPVEKPPSKVTLNLGTLQLARKTDARITKVRGVEGTYRVEVMLPGDRIGRRTTLENVPGEPLNARRVKGAELRAEEKGIRPGYLPVDFIPKRTRLTLRERSSPPYGFFAVPRDPPVDRPTNVFAPDDRYIYQDTSFPWCTVGRVDTPLGWCTGCTIGRRLLLTGNHCIQWNADGTTGWVRFRPAYYNGSAPFGETWATRVIYWRQTTPGNDLTNNNEAAFDYVVCVLDTAMGDIVGYPGYRTYSSSWNGGSYWQHMGFPTDLSGGERPAFQGSCVISTAENESTSGQTGYVLGHFNDVVPGHSGGAVWGWWSGEPWPRVVGVQSAEASTPANNTSGDNEFGGGPALSSLISWARSKYP